MEYVHQKNRIFQPASCCHHHHPVWPEEEEEESENCCVLCCVCACVLIRVSRCARHGDHRYETMPTSVGGGHGLVISRRVLLIVGLTVSIVLVVCAFTLLLVLQGFSFLFLTSVFFFFFLHNNIYLFFFFFFFLLFWRVRFSICWSYLRDSIFLSTAPSKTVYDRRQTHVCYLDLCVYVSHI